MFSHSQKKGSIREILDINEQTLRENGFNDPWYEEKILENQSALTQLKNRLDELDKYDGRTKWIELFKGLFAGNLYTGRR